MLLGNIKGREYKRGTTVGHPKDALGNVLEDYLTQLPSAKSIHKQLNFRQQKVFEN
jgi:hypothetical protein